RGVLRQRLCRIEAGDLRLRHVREEERAAVLVVLGERRLALRALLTEEERLARGVVRGDLPREIDDALLLRIELLDQHRRGPHAPEDAGDGRRLRREAARQGRAAPLREPLLPGGASRVVPTAAGLPLPDELVVPREHPRRERALVHERAERRRLVEAPVER